MKMDEFSKHDDMYSFEQSEKEIFEFEEILCAFGVKIGKGSQLEKLALGVLDLFYKHQYPLHQDENKDIRLWIRECLGINHLVQRTLRVKNHADFAQLAKHLKLLNKGIPAQNVFADVFDHSANKIFELLVATAIMPYSTDLSLDDPEGSKGDNPDVIVKINRKRWAFACKVSHAKKGRTLFNNIEKGIDQIEKCPTADTGVVIINLKNILDHDKYWSILNQEAWRRGEEPPKFSGLKSLKEARRVLKEEINEIRGIIVRDGGLGDLLTLFRNKKSIPAFLLYAHTTVGSVMLGHPIPTSIAFITLVPVCELSADEKLVLDKLNDGLQYMPKMEGINYKHHRVNEDA